MGGLKIPKVLSFWNVDVPLSLAGVAVWFHVPVWLVTWICSLYLGLKDGLLSQNFLEFISYLCPDVYR